MKVVTAQLDDVQLSLRGLSALDAQPDCVWNLSVLDRQILCIGEGVCCTTLVSQSTLQRHPLDSA